MLSESVVWDVDLTQILFRVASYFWSPSIPPPGKKNINIHYSAAIYLYFFRTRDKIKTSQK